jgi:2'-5' RNA ligase
MGVRAFFAFELDRRTAGLFDSAGHIYLDEDPAWVGEKWVPAENLHVTVGFMPSLPAQEADPLVHEVSLAVDGSLPFDLVAEGICVVPHPGRAKMLWGTFGQGDRTAAEIAGIVADVAGAYLDHAPARRFVPHVTLVRARRPLPCLGQAISSASASILAADLELRTITVRSIALFSSTLGPAGPVYEVLSRTRIED